MKSAPRILITGAAGNLGGLLASHLAARGHTLRLTHHKRPLSPELAAAPGIETVRADLGEMSTLATGVATL